MNRLTFKIFFFGLAVTIYSGCTTGIKNPEFFPGKYPGKPYVLINEDKITLSNDAIEVEWRIQANSITMAEITNKYDHQSLLLNKITLFAIELSDGKKLTNHDFKLQGALQIENQAATDTLPTKALRYPGKEITGHFISTDKELEIVWKARLREGSNYIRQNVVFKPVKNALQPVKITFFDGKLEGATYAGSVLGSPIECRNFFFGFEHPTAQSKALMVHKIGSISQDYIDVTDIIDAEGEYIVCAVHGWHAPADFNIQSVSLLENKQPVSVDKHLLNGYGGSSLYRLNLENYHTENTYRVQAEILNRVNASGTFDIYRKTDGLLNFFATRLDTLFPGKTISVWSVAGVTPVNQKRRAFHYYLERERARPYKQFLHYNCWWDLTGEGPSSFTSEQVTGRMHAWNKKFIEPYGIQLNSFVLDDGWDDLDNVWYIDPLKFPNGFVPQAELCKGYNSGIGIWMSPFGGYRENKRKRLESAHREGLETNDGGLSLAGPNYYNRFLERALFMIDNYRVNYFKFDGFGGSEPKYLPDMEAGVRIIKILRQHNPDVFVNITGGSWPSPFWLQYADCTWRGSGDAHMAGEGTRTQKFMTYRDGTLHNNIVNRAPYYPLNSIMMVGIVYANLSHGMRCVNDSIEDFKDMVWSFFGAGSNLQELYISHDRMKPEFWPILAEAARWAKENEDILRDVHWVGGSPVNQEVYGFASWKPGKGIITLRNPSDKTKTFVLNLDKLLELPDEYSGYYKIKIRFPEVEKPFEVLSDTIFSIQLDPFESIIYEVEGN